ncbi:TPA: polysaccharide pyruvyl transferase family protein [Campylobacter coli]|nr:polysaccharide pyruvyl transferase family protein [Campylobacter coli]
MEKQDFNNEIFRTLNQIDANTEYVYKGNNFLLFNYSILGRVNLGDYIQTIAVKNALTNIFGEFSYDFFNRDTLNFYSPKYSSLGNNAMVIMQGYFANKLYWLPNNSLKPIYIGVHFNKLAIEFLRHFLSYRPNFFINSKIGCRDLWTHEHCIKMGIESYFSRCLTLTLPKRTERAGQKVFLVGIPDEWLKFIPKDILCDVEQVNQQRVVLNSWRTGQYYQAAEDLLECYKKEAKMVITTALHCAAPCVAMGIPVILIMAKPMENISRFTALNNIIPLYTIQDLKKGMISFEPQEVDIEYLKKMMLENLKLSIIAFSGDGKEKELLEIRNEIQHYRSSLFNF